MSTSSGSESRSERRRADAERNRATIIEAAVTTLRERANASIEDIADTAGVTRQTVYAHFASRKALRRAVVEWVTARIVAEIDAAHVDDGSATAALARLLETSWRAFERYAFVAALDPTDAGESHALHEPIRVRLRRLVERGQDTGDFDTALSPSWAVTAVIALTHAAGEELTAGRMTTREATNAVTISVMRLLGAGRTYEVMLTAQSGFDGDSR